MLSLKSVPVFVLSLLVLEVISSVHGDCSRYDLLPLNGVCLTREAEEVEVRIAESLDDCERMCCTPKEYPVPGVECGALRYTGGTCTLITAKNLRDLCRKYSTSVCVRSVQYVKLCLKGYKKTICSYQKPRTRKFGRRCLSTTAESVRKNTTRSIDHCKNQCSQSKTCLAFGYLPVNQCAMYFTKYGRYPKELETRDCDNSVHLIKLQRVSIFNSIGLNFGIGG